MGRTVLVRWVRGLGASALMALAGCGDGGMGTNPDGGVPAPDAFAALEDTGMVVSEDAGSDAGPRDDAGDPLLAPPTCTSGRTWTFGNRGNPSMNPGQPCIACHQTMARREPAAFNMTLAGTVYPTGHEPDDCNGANGTTGMLQVVVTDATGAEIVMVPNMVGNFSSTQAVTFPITALVRSPAGERRMTGMVMSGDCNGCHTQDGAMSAPGRITAP